MSSAPPADGLKPTVLAVDDEPRNLALLRAHLGSIYRLVEAPDGLSALSALRSDPSIDVVLLDVMMPGVSGYETCRLIKADPALQWTPVLLLTALSTQADRNEGLEAGADEFLSKPIDRHELLLRVGVFVRIRLQDRRIARQLDELRELDKLKDDLLSLIVHDLRNPLAGMLGFLSVMLEDAKDPTLREDIEALTSAADRIRDLVDDVLQARHLEEGRLPLHREPIEAGVLFDRVTSALKGSAKERGVSLVSSVGRIDGPIYADGRLLTRALENLTHNALRFSRRGASVELRAQVEADSVEIEIADRGPGIADDFKETLFSKFGDVQLGSGERHGHGLGLYLVKLVAAAHGGAVSFVDREGGGTIFRITLPRGSGAAG